MKFLLVWMSRHQTGAEVTDTEPTLVSWQIRLLLGTEYF